MEKNISIHETGGGERDGSGAGGAAGVPTAVSPGTSRQGETVASVFLGAAGRTGTAGTGKRW